MAAVEPGAVWNGEFRRQLRAYLESGHLSPDAAQELRDALDPAPDPNDLGFVGVVANEADRLGLEEAEVIARFEQGGMER